MSGPAIAEIVTVSTAPTITLDRAGLVVSVAVDTDETAERIAAFDLAVETGNPLGPIIPASAFWVTANGAAFCTDVGAAATPAVLAFDANGNATLTTV